MLLLLVLVLASTATVDSSGCYDGDHPCNTMLTIVNQYRAAQSLAALTCDVRLQAAAQEHSDDMSRTTFTHIGSDGSTVEDRIRKRGYSFLLAGENIAAGSPSPVATMNSLRNSEGWSKIVEPQYSNFGCGFTRGGRYGYYWTQVFAEPTPISTSGYPIQDAVFQYAIVTTDLDRLQSVFSFFEPLQTECLSTTFVHDSGTGNTKSVIFMGKSIALHLNQIFCGGKSNPVLFEGAAPFCPEPVQQTNLPIQVTFTGDASKDILVNALVKNKQQDLADWGRKLAGCDMSMYSAFLLFHGEGLQHAILRPGSGGDTNGLVSFLRTGKRCLVQSLNGITNPDFPTITAIFFFSVHECPPGNTYEERIAHPTFPLVLSSVLEIIIEGPVKRELADVFQKHYDLEVPVLQSA